jgi:DNA modification methylase
MEKLLEFISYKNDLVITDILYNIINGTHPAIFKSYPRDNFLYRFKGDFKPLSKIGWTNFKKLYTFDNTKNVSELSIHVFYRDIKLIHLGE